MKRKIISIYVLVFLLFTGCFSVPVPEVKSNTGVVAIEVDLRLRGNLLNLLPGFVSPTSIFFARLDESGEIHNQKELYMSNHLVGDTAYLFNAKPGTYVAVGFRAIKRDEKSDTQYTNKAYILYDVLMPENMIALSKVKVCTGRVSHMGEFHMVEPEFEDRAKIVDRAQQHYYRKMIPLVYGDAYGKDYFKDKEFDLRKRTVIPSRVNPTFGAIIEREDHSKEVKMELLKSSYSDMKDTKWEPIFSKSLKEECR